MLHREPERVAALHCSGLGEAKGHGWRRAQAALHRAKLRNRKRAPSAHKFRRGIDVVTRGRGRGAHLGLDPRACHWAQRRGNLKPAPASSLEGVLRDAVSKLRCAVALELCCATPSTTSMGAYCGALWR